MISRLKQSLMLHHDHQVAEALGLTKTAFAERKRRNSIPMDKLQLIAERESINMDWLLTGEGQVRIQGVKVEDPIFFEAVFCRMMDRLKRIYKEGDFKKLSALQSTLEVFDPGEDDED